jgi:hypothetical protein
MNKLNPVYHGEAGVRTLKELARGYLNLPDGMRRPVSSGMRYAPDDRRALSTKKETGDEED